MYGLPYLLHWINTKLFQWALSWRQLSPELEQDMNVYHQERVAFRDAEQHYFQHRWSLILVEQDLMGKTLSGIYPKSDIRNSRQGTDDRKAELERDMEAYHQARVAFRRAEKLYFRSRISLYSVEQQIMEKDIKGVYPDPILDLLQDSGDEGALSDNVVSVVKHQDIVEV
jgi:hypothetical protein